MRASFHSNDVGFTMIEVIAVLLILIVVAAVAINRGLPTQNDLVPQADVMKSHLRYAQLRALSDDVDTWSISITSSGYSLNCSGAKCPASVQLPSEAGNSHDFSRYNITVSSSLSPINYDRWGSPGTSDITITLTQNGDSKAFKVIANTGYIPIDS